MVEYIWIRAGWDGKYWLWTPRRNLKLKITEIRGVARIFKRGRGGGSHCVLTSFNFAT